MVLNLWGGKSYVHECMHRSFLHSHQREAKRPRCVERGRADSAGVRSVDFKHWHGDPCRFKDQQTSDGVTKGGSVESFERTLKGQRLDILRERIESKQCTLKDAACRDS